LFAYFQRVPLPPEFATDKLVPYFMSLAFPAGAVGLVIAAIMAASLSSIDSAINSCTSVAVVDLYNRVWRGANVRDDAPDSRSGREQVRVSRIFTAIFGVLGTTLACNVSRIGSLLEINAKVVNAFTGPLFGIFLLAMFSRRAASAGVLVAGVVGALTAYYVAYHSAIGFMWPSTFGLAATLIVGVALAGLLPLPPGDRRAALTWHAVMNREADARIGGL
jgi:solute:Na+ symporter, SSS family